MEDFQPLFKEKELIGYDNIIIKNDTPIVLKADLSNYTFADGEIKIKTKEQIIAEQKEMEWTSSELFELFNEI